MKRLLFILSIFLFTTYGCQEDTILPTVVSGNARAVPTSIKAGESTTIVIENLVGVVKATANNVDIPISIGSKSFILTSTTTFNVTFYGTDKVVEQTITVNVEPIVVVIPTKKDTITNLVSAIPYLLSKVEEETSDGVWYEQTISDLEARKVYTFSKDGIFSLYDPLGIGVSGSSTWKLSEDLTSITFAGQTYTILYLGKDKLVLGFWYQKLDVKTNKWVDYRRGRETFIHKQ